MSVSISAMWLERDVLNVVAFVRPHAAVGAEEGQWGPLRHAIQAAEARSRHTKEDQLVVVAIGTYIQKSN